jgi:hypothetical protein
MRQVKITVIPTDLEMYQLYETLLAQAGEKAPEVVIPDSPDGKNDKG